MGALALPRRVEADARCEAVHAALAASAVPLWTRGTIDVARVPATPPVLAALRAAVRGGDAQRGLESIAEALAAQRRGLLRGHDGRVSRLLVCTADGSERFYRAVERELVTHAPRVLGLLIEMDAAALGAELFGADAVAKAVLLERKDAVADVLLALVPARAGA